jgi:hypothetical protein
VSIFDQLAATARRLGPLGAIPARGLELYGRGVAVTERLALGALRARMDAVAPPGQLPSASNTDALASPRALMAQLLERSLTEDASAGRQDSHVAVLRQLVPDEARILATLATGPPAPLVHVLARASGERILENASLIGRSAALTLPSRTPAYVTHLLALGLVETGPEDSENKQGYELLMADRAVRAALKQGELSKLPARTIKRTLMLSAQGRELWEASQP